MSGAMLECVICNARKWKSLEEAHQEDLRLSGAARLFCDGCTRETYWLYSQNESGSAPLRKTAEAPARTDISAGQHSPAAGAAETGMRSMQTERRIATERRGRSRRGNRRVALQVPVRVRAMSAASQFEEVTRTINVCKNGLYFQTDRAYTKGLPVYVAMNYSAKEPGMASEQKATVVRVDSFPGSRTHGVAVQMH